MELNARRSRFTWLWVKIGVTFGKLPLTPNQWTLLGLGLALAVVWFLLQQAWLAAAGMFFLAGMIDMVDGNVARVTGRVTLFGAYLDTIVDRYMEGMIVAALFLIHLPDVYLPAAFWIFFYYFGSIMSTYVKAAAKEKGYVKEEIRGGMVERPEKMIMLFVGIVAARFDPLYLVYVLIIMGTLAHITALQRIALAMRLNRNEA